MAQKNFQRRASKPDHALKLGFLILASFLVFLGIFVFVQLKAQNQPICANSISCVNDLSGKREANNEGIFMGREITAPPEENTTNPIIKIESVLGDSSVVDNKHIYVDLTHQKLYAYDGNNRIFDFTISSGKWNPTPTGTFRIHVWLRYTHMVGGDPSNGTYYDLPNVPYTMYFGNADIPWTLGYSLHGAYWHHNFGHPMSHGCINMKIPDSQKMYYWTNPHAGDVTYETAKNPGTLITIYGTAPAN